MKIQISQEFALESNIPFERVHNFQMAWEVNEHAEFYLTGILQADADMNLLLQNSNVRLFLNDEIIFTGIIVEEKRKYDGIHMVTIRAMSASVKLDKERNSCVYQRVEQSYFEIAQLLVEKAGGSVIEIANRKKIGKPHIAYQETDWEFIRRLASHHETCIIADIVTGKPNIWFGMKIGKEIKESIWDEKVVIGVEKSYDQKGRAKVTRMCKMDSIKSYSLGDWLDLNGCRYFICEKQLRFDKGMYLFTYRLSENIKVKTFYNEAFTGLSLTGKVIARRNEEIQVKFDIAGEVGEYYYSWRPETGNAMYAMPEEGEVVSVYFDSCNERNGVAIRCMNYGSHQNEIADKVNEVNEETVLRMKEKQLELLKSGQALSLGDSSRVNINGGYIEIEGSGSVKMKARSIRVSAVAEIKAVAE